MDNKLVVTNAESEIITNQLLENVITQIADRPEGNVHVKSFSVTGGSQKGDNYGSVTSSVKVIVQIGDVETTYHLFIKIPHSDSFMRDWFINRVNLFTKESLAYLEIIPAMIRLQTDKGLKHMGPSVPVHYHSIIEKAGGLVVIEDLRPQNYTSADKRSGLDEAHCKLVMRELAIFHALAFALKKQNPQSMKKLDAELQEAVYDSPLREFYCYAFKSTLALVKDVTKDQNIIAATETLQSMDLKVIMAAQLQPDEPFAVICHGDVWCNNMLFRYATQGDVKTPVDVKLVDLQCFRYALPTTDLTYFFYSSTTRTTRKKHLKNLLALYYSHFTEYLKRLDVDFPEFTLDVLEQLFRQSAWFGIANAFIWIPAMLSKPEHAPDVSQAQDENVGKYFFDVVNKTLSTQENSFILEDRLVGVIEEAIEMGLL